MAIPTALTATLPGTSPSWINCERPEPKTTCDSRPCLPNEPACGRGLARQLADRPTWGVELHGIALGDDIALIGMAAEPFATTGMAIKSQSPFATTLVSGYTGVGWAYMPTADAYPLGGYEIEVTPFAPEAAEIAAAACVDLLNALAAGEGDDS